MCPSPLLPIYNVIQFKCCNLCFTRFFLCKSLSVTILFFSRYICIIMYQLRIGGIKILKKKKIRTLLVHRHSNIRSPSVLLFLTSSMDTEFLLSRLKLFRIWQVNQGKFIPNRYLDTALKGFALTLRAAS